jgi:hypothetical protein
MKNLIKLLAALSLLLFASSAYAYTVLGEVPGDPLEWIKWAYTQVLSAKASSSAVKVGLLLWALIGLSKFTSLKKYFDKLGKWKSALPLVLGATAELLYNMPDKAGVSSIFAVLLAGASGSGLISVAWHHIVKAIKPKTEQKV